MTKCIHVAIGSTTSKPGDVAGNLAQIGQFAEQAGRDGADVLLTPELSASGYGGFPEVVATAEPAGAGPIYRALAELAKRTAVTVCAGFVEQGGDRRFLAHYIVWPNGDFKVQRKHRVTRVERPLEPGVPLAPGQGDDDLGQPTALQVEPFEIKGVRCALLICADAGITDINAILMRRGVELLFGPTGAGGKLEDRVRTSDLRTEAGRAKYLEWFEKVFSPGKGVTDCIAYRRGLAAVNMCGYDGRQHAHLGHGMVITPLGEVVAFFHGIPNLDRQRPMYAHGIIDVAQTIDA